MTVQLHSACLRYSSVSPCQNVPSLRLELAGFGIANQGTGTVGSRSLRQWLSCAREDTVLRRSLERDESRACHEQAPSLALYGMIHLFWYTATTA